jgi:hypothetical protein
MAPFHAHSCYTSWCTRLWDHRAFEAQCPAVPSSVHGGEASGTSERMKPNVRVSPAPSSSVSFRIIRAVSLRIMIRKMGFTVS